jgi:hypothetical protein
MVQLPGHPDANHCGAGVLEFGNGSATGTDRRDSAKPENDLVRLQLDAIASLISIRNGSLDATLFDSRLLKKFALTGDMAMRLQWQSSPNFALAAKACIRRSIRRLLFRS